MDFPFPSDFNYAFQYANITQEKKMDSAVTQSEPPGRQSMGSILPHGREGRGGGKGRVGCSTCVVPSLRLFRTRHVFAGSTCYSRFLSVVPNQSRTSNLPPCHKHCFGTVLRKSRETNLVHLNSGKRTSCDKAESSARGIDRPTRRYRHFGPQQRRRLGLECGPRGCGGTPFRSLVRILPDGG